MRERQWLRSRSCTADRSGCWPARPSGASFKLPLSLAKSSLRLGGVEAALRAIAEPRRRRILVLVREGEMSAGEIARQFDVSWPAVSQHLAVLKEAGLVSERRAGTRRLYRARREGLTELRSFLEGFWDERLGKLKREAEIEEATRRGHDR
ncbi:MAG: helix-turn-helix transcriptional regulator [Chloroflexi bacterium]|nr:helix-turn-helix transcriptional regulator [Chloroflexota bacterium]